MGAGAAMLSRSDVLPSRFQLREWQRPIGRVIGIAALLGLAAVSAILIYRRDRADYNHYVEMRRCAMQFVPYVPADQSIVAFGGWLTDEYGTPVAHNESMLFGWMDRKGFNYATENLSIPTLDAIASRGGRWWIVARPELEEHHMIDQANARYRRVAACDDRYYLTTCSPERPHHERAHHHHRLHRRRAPGSRPRRVLRDVSPSPRCQRRSRRSSSPRRLPRVSWCSPTWLSSRSASTPRRCASSSCA
jgi:hypothetical protein